MKYPTCKKCSCEHDIFGEGELTETYYKWECCECLTKNIIHFLTPAIIKAVEELEKKFLQCNKKDIDYATAVLLNTFAPVLKGNNDEK